jgi:hypothetical protein
VAEREGHDHEVELDLVAHRGDEERSKDAPPEAGEHEAESVEEWREKDEERGTGEDPGGYF